MPQARAAAATGLLQQSNNLRFHDLRHEATSTLAPILELHEMAKTGGWKDTRMLLRYYHPDGRELARKIARSPLGRQQTARIKLLHAAGVPRRPDSSGLSAQSP